MSCRSNVTSNNSWAKMYKNFPYHWRYIYGAVSVSFVSIFRIACIASHLKLSCLGVLFRHVVAMDRLVRLVKKTILGAPCRGFKGQTAASPYNMKIPVSGLLDSDEQATVQHVMMEQLLVMTIHPGWPLPSCGLAEPERAHLVLFERLKHGHEETENSIF